MKTDRELLILGIKARQQELHVKFFDILNTIVSLHETGSISQLNELQREFMTLDAKLFQMDPKHKEIPF